MWTCAIRPSCKQAMSPQTKVVYCESPANPNMRLADIAAVAEIAHAGGAKLVVDNTYCTPYLQQPLVLGADVSVHSMTKYLGGHGDLTAGAAIFADAELAKHVRLYGLKDMTGAVMSAPDAQQVMRGLKTLTLRMDRHCQNAQHIAELLERHPATSAVHFPGLPSFPQHELAKRQMSQFGGMVAFELHGGLASRRALHGRVAPHHPRRQPGRRREPGPAPGQHDPLHLHARRARGPRHQRRPGAFVDRSGRPGRHRGRHRTGARPGHGHGRGQRDAGNERRQAPAAAAPSCSAPA